MFNKLGNKIRELERKRITAVFVCVALFVVIILILFSFPPPTPVTTRVNEVVSPPVVKVNPELKLVEIAPKEGKREDIDGFSKTMFRFSAPILAETVRVAVTPNIKVNTVVYKYAPNVLVVKADNAPWSSGVTYTITVKMGLRGSGGEELKSDVVYTFSNIPPESIDYNPI